MEKDSDCLKRDIGQSPKKTLAYPLPFGLSLSKPLID